MTTKNTSGMESAPPPPTPRVRWRAKLTPCDTLHGLPNPDRTPFYGDDMTRRGFELWKEHMDEDERRRLGCPAFFRALVPCDEAGNELTGAAYLRAFLTEGDLGMESAPPHDHRLPQIVAVLPTEADIAGRAARLGACAYCGRGFCLYESASSDMRRKAGEPMRWLHNTCEDAVRVSLGRDPIYTGIKFHQCYGRTPCTGSEDPTR